MKCITLQIMKTVALIINTDEPKLIIESDLGPFLTAGSIPNTVTEIIFDDKFNTQINPGVIPMGTKILYFGDSFNQEILPNSIPDSVESVRFGSSYNCSLCDRLPKNLKYLYIFSDRYLHEKTLPTEPEIFFKLCRKEYSSIPENVTNLLIRYMDKESSRIKLSKNVKNVYVSNSIFENSPIPRSVSCFFDFFENNPHAKYHMYVSDPKRVGNIDFRIFKDFIIHTTSDQESINKFIHMTNITGDFYLFDLCKKDTISTELSKIPVYEDEIKNLKAKIDLLRQQYNKMIQQLSCLSSEL